MQLKTISYTQFEGKPEEWSITDFSFGNINLIVGKNATGKSRTLNVIVALGNLVSGDVKLAFRSGDYKVIFNKNGEQLTYILKYEESKVIAEKLIVGSNIRLDRGAKGKGTIYAAKENKDIDFQAPQSELACTRRDSIQHPFFEDLYIWGKNLRHYYFGKQLGQDSYAIFQKDTEEKELNLKQTDRIVEILHDGKKKYPEFIKRVKADIAKIGFDFKNITIGPPKGIVFQGLLVGTQPQGILVKESDLKGTTEQQEMSQGMFRTLSLIIQLNYSLLTGIPSCILIDDIGEGLDYERSSALIKLLVDKAKNSHVQLIMSTNDRFAMNNVPLEYWSIMQRFPDHSEVYNYENSKKLFEDFELTGLSNFDFFTSRSFEGEHSKK